MGKNEHYSEEVVELTLLNKTHLFHIVPDDFPIPEDGILGLPLMDSYNFKLSNNQLQLDDQYYPLLVDKICIPPNSAKFVTLNHMRKNGHTIITNHPDIDDAIFRITDGKITIPFINNSDKAKIIETKSIVTSPPIKVESLKEKINYITTEEFSKRLKLLKENTRIDHIKPKIKESIEKIIHSYHDVFTLPGDPIPYTECASHKIILKDEKPIDNRSYRPPECHKEEITRQIDEMLKKNIIRQSNSPWNSPIWVVGKKKDASGLKKYRIVIDYRKLNDKSDLDAYPLPLIEDILDGLSKAKFFSAFDLSSGFWQIPLEEDSKKYTAFSTQEGHFEFNRLPFGLKNSPSTFQRMMDTVLRGLIGKICFVYLDDIVVYGSTIEEHNKNLVTVLERLRQTGLRLQPDKCEYLRPELEYLGHVITENGVKPNPEKLSAVTNFKRPTKVSEVQSFLGLTGYYRKFIQDFSTKVKPLTELTKKNHPFLWT